MANGTERLMVSVPPDMKNEIDVIKQREFYNKSYAALYRRIIRLGIDKMNEKTVNDDKNNCALSDKMIQS